MDDETEITRLAAHTLVDMAALWNDQSGMPDGWLPDIANRLMEIDAITATRDDDDVLHVNPSHLIAAAGHFAEVLIRRDIEATGADRLTILHEARERLDAMYSFESD